MEQDAAQLIAEIDRLGNGYATLAGLVGRPVVLWSVLITAVVLGYSCCAAGGIWPGRSSAPQPRSCASQEAGHKVARSPGRHPAVPSRPGCRDLRRTQGGSVPEVRAGDPTGADELRRPA